MGSLFDTYKNKGAAMAAPSPTPVAQPATLGSAVAAISPAAFGSVFAAPAAPAASPVFAAPAPAPVAPMPRPAPVAPMPRPAAVAPTPRPAAVAPTPAPARALSTFDPFAVITGQGSGDADAVLNAIVARSEEKPSFMGPFNTVLLVGGQGGGMLSPHQDVPVEAARLLPSGKFPFGAVFLGWRMNVLAFPMSKADADAKGLKAGAMFSGSASCGDAAPVLLIQKACEVYQYTKAGEKAKFDNLGHVRPSLELLFLSIVNGQPIVYVVITPPNHTAVTETLVNLSKALPGGKMQAVPMTVTPDTTEVPGAAKWLCHSLKFALGLPTSPEWTFFAANRDALRADAEFGAKLTEWSRTSLDEKAIQALTTISAMGKG